MRLLTITNKNCSPYEDTFSLKPISGPHPFSQSRNPLPTRGYFPEFLINLLLRPLQIQMLGYRPPRLPCSLRHIHIKALSGPRTLESPFACPQHIRSSVVGPAHSQPPPPSNSDVTIIKLCSEQQQQPQRYRFAMAEQLSELEFSFLDQSSVLCTLPSLPF